jgi:hypothetical protein
MEPESVSNKNRSTGPSEGSPNASAPVTPNLGGNVIARGKPIVVNGVRGIRISQIASRQERLMTTSRHTAESGENSA